MNATILSPSEQLVRHVRDLLVRDGNDLSRNLVIFAGKRPAFFLRRDIGALVGDTYVPPVILSVDQLIERLADLHRPEPARRIDPIEAIALLFGIHTSLKERLGDDQFLTPDRFFPLGEKILTELEEMKLALVTPAQARAAISAVTSGNAYLMSGMYEMFYETLASRGLTTRAADYVTASTSVTEEDLAHVERIVIAGLYALTPSEQVLFRAMGEWEKTRFLFVEGPGLKGHLEHLGIKSDTGRPSPPPTITYVSSPDTLGQVGTIASRIAAAKELPDESSVLVVPDPASLFPVVNTLLPLFPEDGYNISMGYPLHRTPLAGLFSSLARAIEDRNGDAYVLPSYLSVMLHPYIKNARFGDRTDVTRILIHSMEELFLRTSGVSMRTLEEIEQDDEIFTRAATRLQQDDIDASALRAHLIALHDQLFRAWRDDATLGDFVTDCQNLVEFLHDHTTATRHPYFRSFAEVMMEGVRMIGNSSFSGVRGIGAAGAFRFLRHVLRGRTVPFPGSPLHGYQVLGLLETRGLSFETVTIIDANEGILPPTGDAAPLLPQRVREKLSMETRADRDRIAEYYFSVLIRGAKEVVIAWNEADGSEKSRFVERLLWEEERSRGVAPTPDRVRYRAHLDAPRPRPLRKSPEDLAVIRRRTLSASALDDVLHCQLRFYYRFVLGLRERRELSGALEASDIGSIVHDVLRRSFDGMDERPLTEADIAAIDIESHVDRVLQERSGRMDSAALILTRERIVSRLRSFLTEYQLPLVREEGIEIVERETSLDGEIGGLRFHTRPDRVERRGKERGTTHILDYKTGGNTDRQRIRFEKIDPTDKATWEEAIGSLQLYVYTRLYAQRHGLDPAGVQAAYVLLGSGTIDDTIEKGMFEGDVDAAQHLQTLDTVVASLLKELVDENVPLRPTSRPEDECPNCAFTAICGTTWTEKRGR